MANEPIKKFKAGQFSASIFMNTQKTKDGVEIQVPSVTMQKSWLKAGGDAKVSADWENQKVTYFNALEIAKAIHVLQQAQASLLEKDY